MGEAGPGPLPLLSTYGAPPGDGGGAGAPGLGQTWGWKGHAGGGGGEEWGKRSCLGLGNWEAEEMS
jgi:hypothetical protein